MEGLKIASHLPGIVTERVSRRLFGDGAEWSKTMLTLHCEQSPLSASSITLAEDRDSIGLLKARLDWQISGHEIRTLRNYLRRAAEVFSSRRFAKIEAPKGFYEDDSLVISLCADSNHHMGGARMAVSSSQGIVDSNLKLHGISNGYLCSSAVFPCSGFSNPTHTMLALGMRLADHLRSNAEKIGTEVLTPSRTAGSMREVSLKHQGNRLPQLGFGCSYLLGPTVDRAKSLRLLEAAYDAGIRYFDTARLYGQGQCEPLLGEFLRRHPEARVGTKFGIEPPNRVQRAISAVGRRSAAFQRVATMVRGSGKVRFDAATAKASLERSMKELGREEVELFLLHEPERTELIHDDLLEFLLRQRELGRIGNFGIGGEYSRVPELYATRRAYTPVLQFEQSICGPAIHVPEAFRVHYRTFAKPAIALRNRFLADRKLAWWWSEMVGADLLEPQVLSSLLFRAELDTYPEALTLFSASAESHIYANVETSREQNLRDPAQRLKKLIHEDDLGIRAELYHQRESTSL
jgi:aryl-alcohol dehydrogenase-like predicted oxidoreductase